MTQDTVLGWSSPVRRLLGGCFVDYLGMGLFLVFSAVYFTQVVGLTAAQVGAGLGIAGCLALATAAPVGRIADRVGVRRALIALHLVRALGTGSYALAGEWWGFLAAVSVVTVADQAIAALTQAFVAEITGVAGRGRVLAAYRTVANLGISIGGPLGGLLVAGGGPAFRIMLLAGAAAYVVVALVLASITVEGRPVTRTVAGGAAWRDRRVLALASIDTVLQLWLPVLNLGFPLWLTSTGTLPQGWIGGLYAVNTVLCVLLQVPVVRLARTVRAARWCQVAGGAALAGSALVLWAAGAPGAPGWLFAAAIVLLTCGELVSVSAAWTLSYAVAPEGRRAEYLAAFGMGRSFGRYALGPVLVTGLLQAFGGWVWGALAVLFAGAGLATLAVRVGLDERVPG
ncbi:MFS transporter [Nonomuraea sp. NBC_01738]|uniref:MFS transporter n=1 Tax=Nonomuraea sp. NBC_01738 TaxID=2976003 RepID=UPI002E0D8C25|nr:MFS transporter [Nonomuraea sp. NBC_01738]